MSIATRAAKVESSIGATCPLAKTLRDPCDFRSGITYTQSKPHYRSLSEPALFNSVSSSLKISVPSWSLLLCKTTLPC